MTTEAHRSHRAVARAEDQGALVDLLVAYVDRAYATAGQPGALSAVRNLFRQMEPSALTGLAYQMGLEVEPPEEDEPPPRAP